MGFGIYSTYIYYTRGTWLNQGAVIYSIFIAAWANIILEEWKRKECRLAMTWGMSDFEEKEALRPEYHGEEIVSFIDGSDIKFFPTHHVCYLRQRAFLSCVFALVLKIGKRNTGKRQTDYC